VFEFFFPQWYFVAILHGLFFKILNGFSWVEGCVSKVDVLFFYTIDL
jgi:hypothetical protein